MKLPAMATLVLVVLAALTAASAAPWFDIFGLSRPRRPQQPARQARGNGYKEICRTVNPDNYAFPGQQPYPSGPLCPW